MENHRVTCSLTTASTFMSLTIRAPGKGRSRGHRSILPINDNLLALPIDLRTNKIRNNDIDLRNIVMEIKLLIGKCITNYRARSLATSRRERPRTGVDGTCRAVSMSWRNRCSKEGKPWWGRKSYQSSFFNSFFKECTRYFHCVYRGRAESQSCLRRFCGITTEPILKGKVLVMSSLRTRFRALISASRVFASRKSSPPSSCSFARN